MKIKIPFEEVLEAAADRSKNASVFVPAPGSRADLFLTETRGQLVFGETVGVNDLGAHPRLRICFSAPGRQPLVTQLKDVFYRQ